MPEGGRDAIVELVRRDAVMAYLDPIIGQAAEEFPAALAQLREQFPVNNGALGVVGGSAGGAVALEILARAEVPIKAAALVNPAVRTRSVVGILWSVRCATGTRYPTTSG